MADKPQFADEIRSDEAQISTANTNLDGTGTIADVIASDQPNTAGTIITRIEIKAAVATTAGMVRLFLHDGTNSRLWKEIDVTVITPSATVKSFSHTLTFTDLKIESGWKLQASTEKAETFNVIAFGLDVGTD